MLLVSERVNNSLQHFNQDGGSSSFPGKEKEVLLTELKTPDDWQSFQAQSREQIECNPGFITNIHNLKMEHSIGNYG